jgi:hypothetical protein
MSRNQKTGKEGEDLAVRHLEAAGYEILERNWRFSRAEVDIICRKDEILVFVEVDEKLYLFRGAGGVCPGQKGEADHGCGQCLYGFHWARMAIPV